MAWAERFLLTALMATLTACATGGGGRGNDPAVDVRTHARLLRMADARVVDSVAVRTALSGRARATRAAAALALGQVHARDWSPMLRSLLEDPDPVVGGAAAFALGLLSDTASAARLVAVLERPGVGPSAAFALGRLGQAAAGDIVAALDTAPDDAETVGELLLAASRLRPVPLEPVASRLRHPSPEVRWRAAYAFARSYAPAGTRPLLASREDSSARVRAFVARGLARTASGDSLADEALAALAQLVRDAHPQVRVNALRALATHGTAATEHVQAALRDPDVSVRIAAADAMASTHQELPRAWSRAWWIDTTFAFRRAVLASAFRNGRLFTDEWRVRRWFERVAFAEAVSGIPRDERRASVARSLMSDPDARVRAAALGAMAARGGDSLAVVRRELLGRAVRGELWERAVALAALAERPRASEVGIVLDAYARAAADSVSDARIAAARFLATLWRSDSLALAPFERQRIRTLPAPSSDPVTRAAVGGVPPFDHWSTMPGTERPLAWYQDRVRELVVPAAAGTLPRVTLETARGMIVVELFADVAPLTVHNFLTLANAGYYDGVVFHRVIPNFVAQTGDRSGSGSGGPAHVIRDELNPRRYDRGTVGMALSGPDTGGSQFFLAHSPQPHLDGGYTVFGRVVEGLEVLDAVLQRDRLLRVHAPHDER